MLPVRPDISSLSSSDDDADTTRQREEYDEHMLPRALPVTDFPKVNDRSDKGVAVYEHDGLLEKCVVEYVEAVQHKLLVAVANIFIPSRRPRRRRPRRRSLSLSFSLNRRCAFNKCAPFVCASRKKKYVVLIVLIRLERLERREKERSLKKRRESEEIDGSRRFLTFYFQIPL